MNIIITSGIDSPINEHHHFVTVGPQCWGKGATVKEAFKNCKANAPRGYRGHFITRVSLKVGFNIDPIDGGIGWDPRHDAKNCPFCTVGKNIQVHTDKTWKEKQ